MYIIQYPSVHIPLFLFDLHCCYYNVQLILFSRSDVFGGSLCHLSDLETRSYNQEMVIQTFQELE